MTDLTRPRTPPAGLGSTPALPGMTLEDAVREIARLQQAVSSLLSSPDAAPAPGNGQEFEFLSRIQGQTIMRRRAVMVDGEITSIGEEMAAGTVAASGKSGPTVVNNNQTVVNNNVVGGNYAFGLWGTTGEL